ncbi:MAG: lipase maturation factor family protein [Candidatus Melainabacteria bacterium]|nr:lipase maturation factor family protein [Candidatus Melainabacteria bacterium]
MKNNNIRFLFLKLLGAIYLIAFASLGVQIPGLIGSNGILPASQFLEMLCAQMGYERYWFVPTLFWLNSSDVFLIFLCCVGMLLSVLLIFEFFQPVCLLFLWIFYLSFVNVSGDFFSFQWDNLLLEVGFLSIFYALCPSSKIVLWLLRLVLFKLMFFSGIVKLLSGDVAWKSFTALTYHYETQPLPNLFSYYFHQFPNWFHSLSCKLMFAIELIVPFFIFIKRRYRVFGSIILIAFQLIIMVTGNYCFFNLLTILLCVLLLDDNSLLQKFTESKKDPIKIDPKKQKWITVPIASLILIITTMQFSIVFQIQIDWPMPLKQLYSLVLPFRSVNTYGLFAVMTTSRSEIIIEGSNDLKNWFAYEFKYKPGDLKKFPCFVAPHQPRLDWQMWFAALGSYRNNQWFINFCVRLLQGSKDVLKLIAYNPFSDSPPHYLRALIYDYKFTDMDTKHRTGNLWKRELKGLYFPVVTLKEDRLLPITLNN